ncbi:MAG: hypothetical protein HYW70_03325 [Candidatus Nealsonbacteria bacterium]|nr:hypothetical protein [Candidatus Nealsonbacteria bacterium]
MKKNLEIIVWSVILGVVFINSLFGIEMFGGKEITSRLTGLTSALSIGLAFYYTSNQEKFLAGVFGSIGILNLLQAIQ